MESAPDYTAKCAFWRGKLVLREIYRMTENDLNNHFIQRASSLAMF